MEGKETNAINPVKGASCSGLNKINDIIIALQKANMILNSGIISLETKGTAHDTAITALQAADIAHDTAITALQAADITHDTAITALQAADIAHDTAITALQNATDNVTINSPLSAVFFKIAHPVGRVLATTSSRNPGSYFQSTASTAEDYSGACGRWEKYGKGCVLIGAGTSDAAYSVTGSNAKQGGASKVTLSIEQMPAHRHSFRYHDTYGDYSNGGFKLEDPPHNKGSNEMDLAGGGQSHENMPPYIVVYYFRRIA